MALPNPGMSFTPFDPLPASDLNDLVENIESLADGSGLAVGSIAAHPTMIIAGATGAPPVPIGKTTLGVAGDTLSVASLPNFKYLRVLIATIATGAITGKLRLNNDSGNNYAWRRSVNGAADTGTTSTSEVDMGADSNTFDLYVIDIVNVAAREKVLQAWRNVATAGAANNNSRIEVSAKWANTSAAINRIDLVNTGAGDFAIGSEMIVLGFN